MIFLFFHFMFERSCDSFLSSRRMEIFVQNVEWEVRQVTLILNFVVFFGFHKSFAFQHDP